MQELPRVKSSRKNKGVSSTVACVPIVMVLALERLTGRMI